jgi:Putative DNA-binding domain
MFPTDDDILNRLTAVEDSTTERKPIADSRGWVKTAVAFSNSLAVGQPGILFVGVKDNGDIEEKETNFERLLRHVSGELSNIYPPIYPTTLVKEKDGKQFVAVIVYGSADRPHFAGKSYIRDGTQTIEASEENFRELIARRSSKVDEILKWKGQAVGLDARGSTVIRKVILIDCNQHWLTVQSTKGPYNHASFPLPSVELSYDHHDRFLLLKVTSELNRFF